MVISLPWEFFLKTASTREKRTKGIGDKIYLDVVNKTLYTYLTHL